MRFIQAFQFSNYLLVVLGYFSLYIAEFLPAYMLLLPVVAIYLLERPGMRQKIHALPTKIVNTVVLSLFGYFFFLEFLIREDLISAVIYFTVYLQVIKLVTAKKNRDYFQVYVLALTHLISSTLLTVDVVFIIPFILFIILAPWVFTLFNLKVQLENAYLGPEKERHAKISEENKKKTTHFLRSRKIVSWRFFSVTAALSLALLLNAMVIFFLFPRVSFGFLFRKVQARSAVSGFSENVDLASFGNIKTSDKVVMRVEVEGDVDLENLYWRGLGYDNYTGKSWKRSVEERRNVYVNTLDSTVQLRHAIAGKPFKYTVFLEPLDTKTLFVLDRAYEVSWDKLELEKILRRTRSRKDQQFSISVDAYDALFFNSNLASDRIYGGQSHLTHITAERLRQDTDKSSIPRATLAAYLQLPSFNERFYSLASQIGQSVTNDYDMTMAVANYLKENNSYTLDVPSQGSNPVEGFLFEKKQGHCEYFATAGVLLLRALGVPARLVSGFRGGDWNDYGKYISVRQRDAHTWIEVLFPTYGWQRFDPTPPDTGAAGYREIRFAKLRKFFEFVELRWYKYIINYDLKSQYQVARSFWEKSMSSWKRVQKIRQEKGVIKSILAAFAKRDRSSGRLKISPLTIGIILTTLAFVFMLYLLSGKPRQRGRGRSRDARLAFYYQFLKLAKSKGFNKKPTETPKEFGSKLTKQLTDLEDDTNEMIQAYYQLRFGNQPIHPSKQKRLQVLLKRLAERKVQPKPTKAHRKRI